MERFTVIFSRRHSRRTVGIAVLVAGHLASYLLVEKKPRGRRGGRNLQRGSRCDVCRAGLVSSRHDNATARNPYFGCGGSSSSTRIRDFYLACEWHHRGNGAWSAEMAHRPGAAGTTRSFADELELDKRPQVSIDLDSVRSPTITGGSRAVKILERIEMAWLRI
jgi:hypothetical protein